MLNELAKDIHASNVSAGWWNGYSHKPDRFETAMMLSVSEVSEAMEGFRKSLPDDHLPQHPMFDVELADAMIRLLDLAGALGLDLTRGIEPRISVIRDDIRLKSVPEQLYHVVCAMSVSRRKDECIIDSIATVIAVARHNKVDLWPIVDEKRAYNKTRADHKIEARTAENGKKF